MVELENIKLFSKLYHSKPTYDTKRILADHKNKEMLFKMTAKKPIVLNHSPTRMEQEWNVHKTDRIRGEVSYEEAVRNLRYLKGL